MSKFRKGKNILLFFTSMLLTVFILGSGLLFVFTDSVPSDQKANIIPQQSNNMRLLFCETDNNLSYEINIDFDLSLLTIKRLEFDNSVYHSKGLSGTLATAEALTGGFFGILIATETQTAGLIDYVGGYSCLVGEHISSLCGDIGTGYQTLTGVAITKIFKNEQNNRELCLNIAKTTTENWCKILGEPRNFFKLLSLTTNNLSYTDYLPIADKFKTLCDK